jgi:glutathione peroxidase
MPSLSDFTASRLLGGPEALSDYAGKVVLVVNVASACGYTPQYAGLEQLWHDYRDQGLVVLGFPCNQFGNQEAGSDLEIATFCSTTYNVSFPMFQKIEVNGPAAHPLFSWLKKAAPGLLGFNDVKWNFTKFLVDRDGNTVKRYGSDVEPKSIAPDIETLLAKAAA